MHLASRAHLGVAAAVLLGGTVVAVQWPRPAATSAADIEIPSIEPVVVDRPVVKHADYCRRELVYADQTRMLVLQTFDATGHVTEKRVYGNGQLESRVEREYDGAGRLIRETEHAAAGKRGVTTYRYDAAGRRVEEIRRRPSSQVPMIITYRYDRAGRETEVLEDLDGDGTPDSARLETYNARGHLATVRHHADPATRRGGELERYAYDGDQLVSITLPARSDMPSMPHVTSYRYDARGRLASQNSAELEVVYFYDAADRLIEAHLSPVDPDHGGYRAHTFRYDAAGNLLESQTLDGFGRKPLATDTYSYDCW
jgi:YD repeat-containing protein